MGRERKKGSQRWLLTETRLLPEMRLLPETDGPRGKGAAKHGCDINRRESGKKGGRG
jgi:hypothetical protein